MKLGIDSYCYHRYFGEVYPGIQTRPDGRRMTVDDFLKRAKRHGVEGVSLESCFFPSFAPDALQRLRERLDEYGFERVWAWGHPDGLSSGTGRKAEWDLVAHIAHARAIGAGTMRIVGGSRRDGSRGRGAAGSRGRGIRQDTRGHHSHRATPRARRSSSIDSRCHLHEQGSQRDEGSAD